MWKENTFNLLKRSPFEQIFPEWSEYTGVPREEWFKERGWTWASFLEEYRRRLLY